jgi:hypothetical protein
MAARKRQLTTQAVSPAALRFLIDPWSPEEDAKIRAEYPDCPDTYVLACGMDRSWSALRTRAGKLGVRRSQARIEATKARFNGANPRYRR